MYHAESESYFELQASELEEFYNSNDPDAQLCVDVTGVPMHEARFRKESK